MMAGSWDHVTNDDGTPYQGTHYGMADLLENDGDVTEAVEQMYGMIWWLAGAVAAKGGGAPTRDAMLAAIRQATECHKIGAKVGSQAAPWRPSAGTWRKGDKDPATGTPTRHARQKAYMMLAAATDAQVRAAVRQLADSRPVEVLDALLAVMGDDQ